MTSNWYRASAALLAGTAFVHFGNIALANDAAEVVAAGASELARKFAAREDVRQISMSPDGTRVAFISSRQKTGEVVNVVQLADGALKPILSSTGEDQHLYNCSWISGERLICNFSMRVERAGTLATFTRMVAVNADGSDMKVLEDNRSAFRTLGFSQYGGTVIDLNAGKPGEVLVTHEYVPESSENTRLAETRDGLGVDRLDATSLRRKVIESPQRSAVEYISDGHGNVRVMGLRPLGGNGYASTYIEYVYRKKDDTRWSALSSVQFPDGVIRGFDPIAVDPTQDLVYGFDQKDGFTALYSVSLDGSLTKSLVQEAPGVDVDGLVRIGRERRVVGVSWARENRESRIFDPQLKTLIGALGKAIPGEGALTLLDASEDENRILLMHGSDTNPGVVYLYDKTSHELNEVLAVRPQLGDTKLATMKPISFPAADGTMIPGYLTLPPGSNGKNLPAIVMPHGGPSSRDEWGFDWLVQYYALSGYAVLQPNYRGSAGYGGEWFKKNGFQSWRSSIGDVDDAGRWLLAQGIAAKDKLAIVGWSYGGYAALQSGVTDPGLYKAIVAIAPVTDLELLRQNARDYTNYRVVDGMIGNGPHVREGSPAQNAASIAVPVLMFSGDKDQNVEVAHSRLMERKLRDAGKQVTYVEFPGLAHQLDDSAARLRLLSDSDAFLRKALAIE